MKQIDKKIIETAMIYLGIGIMMGGVIYSSVEDGITYTIISGSILIYLSIFFE